MEVHPSNEEKDKIKYNTLTAFIRRINHLNIEDNDLDMQNQSPTMRQNLIPKLPKSSENCELEMPDGTKHEIPMY